MDYFRDENFKGEQIPGQPTAAWFVCDKKKGGCGEKILEKDKNKFLAKGEWRPTRTPTAYGVRSYHAPAFIAPQGWNAWSMLYDYKINAENGVSGASLQSYFNLYLGLGYMQTFEAIKTEEVQKAHTYKQSAPGMCPPTRCLLQWRLMCIQEKAVGLLGKRKPGLELITHSQYRKVGSKETLGLNQLA